MSDYYNPHPVAPDLSMWQGPYVAILLFFAIIAFTILLYGLWKFVRRGK